MIKRMKEFDENTKKKYEESMIILTDQYSSSNVYREHDDKLPNAYSGEMKISMCRMKDIRIEMSP